MNPTETNEVAELTKLTLNTFLNIVQMARYRVRYVQKGYAGDKEKMYKHAFMAGIGILSLLTMGVLGLIESRRSDYLILV